MMSKLRSAGTATVRKRDEAEQSGHEATASMKTTVTMLAMRGTLSANGWRRAACVLHEVAGEVDETLAEAGARPAPLCVHVNDGEAGRLGIQHLGLPIDVADERGDEFLRHAVKQHTQLVTRAELG